MSDEPPPLCNHFLQYVYSEEFQKEVKENFDKYSWKSNKWQRENPEKHQECIRRYSQTEKGKIANRKKMALRHQRIREHVSDLSSEEKEHIKNFYINCPPGYEVDHIIPVSKGGRHELSNLQYLTKDENRRKGAKMDWEEKE